MAEMTWEWSEASASTQNYELKETQKLEITQVLKFVKKK